MNAPIPVRAGTADQLARLAFHRQLEHADTEALDSVAFWIIGDVGGVGPATALWKRLRPDCLALWPLIAEDWDGGCLDFDPALTEAERYEQTLRRLVVGIETAIWIARYQAAEDRRLAAYRQRRADTEARVHPRGVA